MSSGASWKPVAVSERHVSLDALRGMALFGVLIVNLLTLFRVSLIEHILTFHTHAGWANRVTDVLTAALLEFKSFDLFSMLFGVGVAIQAERAARAGIDVHAFLFRRFVILLLFGLSHMFLIWNGDILTLYAVCGLLLLPFLRLPANWAAVVGIVSIASTVVISFGPDLPSTEALRIHASRATQVYANGGYAEILAFRWVEAREYILPLLVATSRKTFGLMLIGSALWRSVLLKDASAREGALRRVAVAGFVLGGTTTALQVCAESAGIDSWIPGPFAQLGTDIPLAFAYGAAALLWLNRDCQGELKRLFAAAGRMALTNYLAQSLILSVLFYGYGFGLFGRLGSAIAALIGIGIYAGQLLYSRAWLRHFRFGPFEWVWRSLTYGRRW